MKKIFITLFAAALALSSCDSYLDINQDPNSPQEENMTTSIMFPGAEMNLAASYGNYLRITGGYFAQQYSQVFGTSNYLDYSQFTMSATRSSGSYNTLNVGCLKNLENIRNLASANEEWGTYLAATTLRAFTYQILIDCYGETPYSEGLDIDNLSPHYDEGIDVYNGVLVELNDALSKTTASDLVCTNFLFGNSNANNWIQLANVVKLKLLMRMSDTQNVQSELAALIEGGNFPKKNIAWTGIWADELGKANPFYQEEFATYFGSTQTNVILNLALSRTMQDSDDARLKAFFATNSKDEYTGGISGTQFSGSKVYTASYWCRPKVGYSTPVYLITLSEIEFFLAEYYARYGTSDEAESHYKAAIEASFETAGVSGASTIYTTHYPWDNANYKQLIGIQKWVALSGTNTFEAWCEMRRLKYPTFGTVSGTDLYNEGTGAYNPLLLVPGTLYTPIRYNSRLGANKVLQRFRYAENSANRNSNTPKQAEDHDAKPVFWAK